MKLSVAEETKIVALLARGDTRDEIIQALDRPVSKETITAVKKRNQDNLAIIKTKQLEVEASNALAIKQKANDKIKQQLDNDEIHKPQDLIAISREMHAQSKDETKPPENTQLTAELLKAIQDGDELVINQLILNRNDISKPSQAQTV